MDRISCESTDGVVWDGGMQRAAGDENWKAVESSVSAKFKYTADALYKLCYMTGAGAVRFTRTSKRMLVHGIRQVEEKALRKLAVVAERAKVCVRENSFQKFAERVREDVQELREAFADFSQKSLAEQAAGVWKGCRFAARYLYKVVATTLNHVCPVLGIALVFYTAHYFINLPFALSVTYDGKAIGYISDESVFDSAEKMVKERIIYEEYLQPKDIIPKFTICVAEESELTSQDTLTDRIIQASGNEIVEADGLYINEEFIGATTDGESLLLLLDEQKNPYREQYPDAVVEFDKKIKVSKGLYPVSSVVELANIQDYILSEEEGERHYTVKAGDVPINIAKENDVALADLRSMNPGIDTTLLPGQELLISRSVPMLPIRVTRTQNYTEEVTFKIEREVDDTKYRDYEEVTQEGVNGLREVEAQEVYIDGVLVEKTILKENILDEPVNQIITVGSAVRYSKYSSSYGTSSSASVQTEFSAGRAESSGYIWPVGGSGGYVSCGLYGYRGHTGMDIAGIPTGTPIYAVASGQVIVAKQLPGYGKYIVIQHDNGMQTYYLHNSAIYVAVGQRVNQGQTIAGAGRTGNATGVHCHIEFRMNGRVLNPANYL